MRLYITQNNQLRILSICLLSVILFSGTQLKAQSDSTRKNTIKLDLTSYWLYRNAIVFSYERTVKPSQTFVVTAGVQQFPSLGTLDSIDVTQSKRANGTKFGAEYRFYLKKENKYSAPHGVYLGPYFSYLNFKNTRGIEVNNDGTIEKGDLTTKLSVVNIGVQLGYQFVINNRWTLDFVFVGPSISNYFAKMNLDGNFTFDREDVENEVIDALIQKFPGLEDLINDKEISDNGKISTWGYGYRYQFQIGYHFGRKKNKN
jgi:Protein of unknown function (DUF3575)